MGQKKESTVTGLFGARKFMRKGQKLKLAKEATSATRQVEIIGPDGTVHYRRPEGHPMIEEALSRPGYSVRFC